MDYIQFGHGNKTLVILPGLGDGLKTVKGTAFPMYWMYKELTKEYTVYALSRRNDLTDGCTTRDMAKDLDTAMEKLGLGSADVLGVSMGGMIAQWLAIDFPHRVSKLALVVTCAEPNPILEESINEWISCAQNNDHPSLMDSNMKRIYSEEYQRKNKWMIPLVSLLTKPKSYKRFLILAKACLQHNAFPWLHEIYHPVLVLGGEKDLALGGEASYQIAAAIPGAVLKMYPQWGHGLYEEASDFLSTVLCFFRKEM